MESDTLDYGNKVDRVSSNTNINNFEVIYNNGKENKIHNCTIQFLMNHMKKLTGKS
jgi:hypothetical protein